MSLGSAAAQSAAAPEKGIPATTYIIESNANVSSVSLQVTTQDYSNQNYTAPFLYGLMHEDISHSGDGGIYAELLINRAFQGVSVLELVRTTERGARLTSREPGQLVRQPRRAVWPFSDGLVPDRRRLARP